MPKGTSQSGNGQQKFVVHPQDLVRVMREQLKAQMQMGVLQVVEELFEEQCRDLVGEPWSRKGEGSRQRGGSEAGHIYLEGHRVPVRYPRIQEAGRSCALPAYKALRSFDLMAEEVQAKLVRGISTRDYAEAASAIVEGTGLSKTTVSNAFIRASQRSLDQINSRSLSQQLFVALLLDGIAFGDILVVAAMGVTEEGEKVILGLVEGHTENAEVVAGLLENLVERGLALSERFLAVIDGSKALRAALVRRWGSRAVLQRCQQHKKRNVVEHLPPSHAAEARRRMNAAYGMREYEEAKKILANTVAFLKQISEAAARSLEEGLEETLTVVRLGLPEALRRTFSTTNPLESAFDGVRYRTGRVKRWRKGKGQMVLRWTAAAALETEKRFHRIKGHRLLNILIEKLNQNQVDEKKEVG